MKLIEKLKSLGLEKIYFGAGARNAILLEEFSEFELIMGYDERSMAFQALGAAKVLNKPVALVTTSGTAVAEILPALVEAFFSNSKLIFITADRPSALDSSFAPQMVDQKLMLRPYCRNYRDFTYQKGIPIKSHDLLGIYPIGINLKINLENIQESQISYSHDFRFQIDWKKNLFILNSFDNLTHYPKLYEVIKSSPSYVYQEVGSPFYGKTSSNEISSDEVIQKLILDLEIRSIIRIGDCPNSKFWRQLYSTDVYHISPVAKPSLHYGTVILDHEISSKQLIERIPYDPRDLTDLSLNLDKILEKNIKSEVYQIGKLLKALKNDVIFFGNSMPVRYAKFFKIPNKIILARGANGIDGLISMALGAASTNRNQDYSLILGDLSFQYDISALFNDFPKNLKIFIINNQGGQIFERIKTSKEIICSHDKSYGGISKGFEKSYKVIDENFDDFEQINEVKVDNLKTENFWSDYKNIINKVFKSKALA